MKTTITRGISFKNNVLDIVFESPVTFKLNIPTNNQKAIGWAKKRGFRWNPEDKTWDKTDTKIEHLLTDFVKWDEE